MFLVNVSFRHSTVSMLQPEIRSHLFHAIADCIFCLTISNSLLRIHACIEIFINSDVFFVENLNEVRSNGVLQRYVEVARENG